MALLPGPDQTSRGLNLIRSLRTVLPIRDKRGILTYTGVHKSRIENGSVIKHDCLIIDANLPPVLLRGNACGRGKKVAQKERWMVGYR